MIVYQLACRQGHSFDGWFPSASAYDEQAARGQLQCPTCSSGEVRKLPSAPYVQGDRHVQGERHSREGAGPRDPQSGGNPGPKVRAEVLQSLRKFILTNTEDVGRKFAEIARRIHYQEEKNRGIRGQATLEEARELQEEGIPAIAVSPELISNEEIH